MKPQTHEQKQINRLVKDLQIKDLWAKTFINLNNNNHGIKRFK